MADILNFDAIPIPKRVEAKANILAYMPNNQTIDDPAWVDPGDGSPSDQIPVYTDVEWLNEIIWKHLRSCNRRGHEILVLQAAESAIDIRTDVKEI